MSESFDLLTPQKTSRIVRTASPMESVLMAPPVLIRGSLDPYAGPWDHSTARHLLKRAMIAPNAKQISDAVTEGMNATIQKLMTNVFDPGEPLNYNEQNDPNVPIGSSWVNAPITQGLNYPHRSIRAWQFSLHLSEGVSVREKMTMFWHNHFVTSDANHAKLTYQYIKLLRDNALGNFRTLVEEITVNNLMLQYLNGAESNKNAPNENYARELLELFTIGKGIQAGPGDYTNYTEEDIKEIARSLTGWTINVAALQAAGTAPPAIFRPNRHDTGTKTLSHRFNNAVITNGNELEYKSVIDIILQEDEVSKFMARNIYRWFVYYNIDAEVEAMVIEPLAAILKSNNYEVALVLEALFASEHFYHENALGAMIKSPIDFTASVIKPFKVEIDFNQNQTYQLWLSLHGLNQALQQDVFSPPDVAGWKAYYQDPVYYRYWINSVTLTIRRALTDGMAAGQIDVFMRPWGIDVLNVVADIPNALDPNQMIQGILDIILPYPLNAEQLAALKETLIPGLPDFEWTIEYGQYLNDPSNDTVKMAVENRLRFLFLAILSLPEFQLQ